MAGSTIATKTVAELTGEILQKTEDAQSVLAVAEKEKRDLTEQEATRIDGLMAEARKLNVQRELAKERSAGRGISQQEISSLFDGTASGPVGRAKRGAAWGRKVVEACSEGPRFKGLTPAGTVLVAIPQPEPVAMGRPVPAIRDLIHRESTDGYFAFLRQTLRQSNAAPVAPANLKPTSRYTFDRVQDHARVLAHLSESIPRQDISDSPLLERFLDSEMSWGLAAELEDQILNGSGIGENFLGIANTPGVLTVARLAPTTDLGLIKTLRRAVTSLEANGIAGDGWVMSPADWEAVEVSSSTTEDLLLNTAGQAVPIDSSARRLFGLPVVVSVSCVPGTAFLGDWQGSAILYEREGATLTWSENTWDPDALGAGVGASDFSRNLIRFRSEGRWGLGVTRPSGFVKISLT